MPEQWPTILAISFAVSITLVVVVACGKWLLCGKPTRSQRNHNSGDAFSGPIIVSGKKSGRPRTFSGRDNCAVVSAPDCDRVVVDLEDCCKMTICDRVSL